MKTFEELRTEFKNDFKEFRLMESRITFNAATLFEKLRIQSKVKEDGILKLKKNRIIVVDNYDNLHNIIGIKSDVDDNAVFVTTDGTELTLAELSTSTILDVCLEFCLD